MAVARVQHHWLGYDSLDTWSPSLKKSYALAYRFTDVHDDPWTARFNEFKFNRNPAVLNAMRSVAAEAVAYLLERIGVAGHDTVLTTVLGSRQLAAAANGLMESVAAACAERSGCRVDLSVLSKQPYESLSAGRLTADERSERLDSAQYQARSIEASTLILLDDVITSGSTIGHVADTIKQANQRLDVYGVALAKAEGREFNRSQGMELTNDHIPADWERVWTGTYRS